MAKGKIDIDIHMCKGCGICLDACKFGVIKLADQGAANKYGYRYLVAEKPDQCTGCSMCALMCPDCAITVWRDGPKTAGS